MWQSMADPSEVSECLIENCPNDIENRLSHTSVSVNFDRNMEIWKFQNDVDKNNQHMGNSNKYNNDISLYENKGPSQPSEEDPNSRDSGFDSNLIDKEENVNLDNFLQPKLSSEDNKECGGLFCRIFLPMESTDDAIQENNYIKSEENNLASPICNTLVNNQTPVNTRYLIRPMLRRNIYLKEEGHTKYNKLTGIPIPVNKSSPIQPKQYKSNETTHPNVRRSCSANESIVKSALQRSSTNPDLIGDFSKPFCLPLVPGRHQDLKSISPTILTNLIRGKYDGTVSSFLVIDCRFPYEYDGGHIRDAVNYYTKEQIMNRLIKNKANTADGAKRNILVFHCEFSSERAPNLSRFLRNVDRRRNDGSYPALYWPEIYLLDGGYKNFYEHYSEFCIPVAYKPMLDMAHKKDLKYFRAKMKNSKGDTTRFSLRPSNFKRLDFVHNLM